MASYDRHILDGEHLAYLVGKIKTLVGTKQDTISDLADIRSNASSGASKVSCTDETVGGFGYTKNEGTVTGVKMNGASKGSSGVVDLGTVITAHQDISGKADKSTTLAGYGITNAYTKTETYTKAETNTEINNAISGLTGFHFEIVQTLPVTGETNVIYLVLKSSGETGNIYTEYAWINNAWEQLGDTQIALEYLTNGEIDTIWG